MGHLKRIFKDAFRVAGAVQKTCSSEMLGGQGADFLRGVAFWSIRSSGLLRHIVWPGINFSCQAQYFTQVDWKNRKTHWYEALSAALNFPFMKEAPFSPSVASLCHPWVTTTNLSYRFPDFETSATALCGTTGIKWLSCCLASVQTTHLAEWTHVKMLRFWDDFMYLRPLTIRDFEIESMSRFEP